MHWHERLEINELNRMHWNECIETNDLKRMTWHEWIEMNDLKGMNCQKCTEALIVWRFFCEIWLLLQSRAHFVDLIIKKKRKSVFDYILMWSTTWWRCGRQMKWSSRYSRAHTLSTSLSTSSSKSGPKLLFCDDFSVKPGSCYSLVHILSTASLKRGPNLLVLYDLYVTWSSC